MFIEVHGIRFSQGTPHPDVIDVTIPTEMQNAYIDAVIVGDRTLLNVSSQVLQRIYLHSWKDGQVFLVRLPIVLITDSCNNHQMLPLLHRPVA